MISFPFKPLVHLDVIQRLELIDVSVGGKYVYIILILEAINEIYNRPDGAAGFESGGKPVGENQYRLFNVYGLKFN